MYRHYDNDGDMDIFIVNLTIIAYSSEITRETVITGFC